MNNSPANRALIDIWNDIPHELPYGPEEFIHMIDGIEFVDLAGVPDGRDLPYLAVMIGAIRSMCGGDYIKSKEQLTWLKQSMDNDRPKQHSFLGEV